MSSCVASEDEQHEADDEEGCFRFMLMYGVLLFGVNLKIQRPKNFGGC